MDHEAIWRRWFEEEDWDAWRAFLKALFGLRMSAADLTVFKECTGRDVPPRERSLEAWLVVGRRGGKSFMLALVAVYLAAFCDWSPYLAPGERGTIMIICVDRRQARVIFRYCQALLTEVPAIAELVERADNDTIELTNRVNIEISSASFRSVRGYTVIAALCDEIAFWRTEETAANPDREILDALRPAMATVPGAMLLCASSPYAKRGALYDAYREHFGGDGPLVWQAPTLTMHPTLRRSVVDAAYKRDPASAAAEYGAQFRSDLESFVSREIVDSVTIAGRRELPPTRGIKYVAFVDPAGGSGSDSMTLAIAHRDKEGAVLDAIRERRPPFSPEAVITEFADLLDAYRVRKVIGDHWGGEFVREPLRRHGIEYTLSDLPKSDIYRDTLPLLNSGKVELLDMARLSAQLCSLERRTARSGKDSIDHPKGDGWHDDLANAACGALLLASAKQPAIGAMISDDVLMRSRMMPGRRYDPRSFRGAVDLYALHKK